jgi:hypothetical protein
MKMEDLNKAELRHPRTQTAISIHNGDNAVLKKIEDPQYVPQDAQDEMRVARALSVSFGCAAAGKKGQMF